ncbi:hypothetical protein JQ557_19125 [Bradyrhizobium sp. U87765 SZCCT0131]|uniref:hypothetical protein n=1 Tax=unclassified Bradyrhizobium TaxID=2631580 RepID=UPI001BADDDED|nr:MULTISPECIES: hypothetical protein [unclassified Bradyrhizobium]MBR1220126.1 hypothetical protein [Bradyrhizobium sp. U87765 SZCCT0131]MBR1263418.1 hypothetical protein [Bradyrhizobium sp. U87765 SZCCT0134]MBR1306699.1 hypothetical protein [Bradyrhizobium sp. U87765 SZCCT0110]MBR1323198.1 hypothetical protein [Bradyrhizobium sp. U87765 SZCCT0109]MBR1345653.1 hypothetical protein [Bradyrhizobium sp. U87765 SZCCT0048]
MALWPVDSVRIERLDTGGWRVIRCLANAADVPIADFVSHADAREWVDWKLGRPNINRYAIGGDLAQLQLIDVAVEPRSSADGAKLETALSQLAAEDPAFTVSIDPQSGLRLLKGVSEAHLHAKIEALRWTHDIEVRVGSLQVAFRERITRLVEVAYSYRRRTVGWGPSVCLTIIVEPNDAGKGREFTSGIPADALPKPCLAGIEKGLVSALDAGVVAAFPVVDVKVRLVEALCHDVASSAYDLELAARAACHEALQKGHPVLLEPIMAVEVVSPERYAAAILSDLRRRNAQVERQDVWDQVIVVNATASLMNMFGYENVLRSTSEGRAAFTMCFDHYAPVSPPNDDPTFPSAMAMRGSQFTVSNSHQPGDVQRDAG